MTRSSTIIVILILVGMVFLSDSKSFGESGELNSKTMLLENNSIKNDIKYLTKSMEQLKTDQTNYKTERDVLKDAYSSSFQTLNSILTLILAIFGIIGYIGIKDIYSLKTSYDSELAGLKRTKEEFEKEIKILTRQQTKSKIVNEKQNKQIEIIELRDQIGKLMSNNNYNEALALIDKALALNKNNLSILGLKSRCHEKLDQLYDAIKTLEQMIELKEDDKTAIVNLCEAYLLTQQIDKFDNLFNAKILLIKSGYANELVDYFKVIKVYLQGDFDELRETIQSVLCYYRPGKDTRLGRWGFDALERFLDSEKKSDKTELVKNFIHILKGKSDPSEINVSQNINE